MIPLALALATALLAAAPAHAAPHARRAAAVPDTLLAAAKRDRAETRQFFHTSGMSPLATVLRQDFGPDGGWITIGAAPDNAVVLADSGITAHHLRVRVEGQGFRAEAVDTAARFTVRGASTAQATLGPGGIGVGRYTVRLSYQNAPAVIVFDPRKPAASTFAGPTWWAYDRRYRFVVPLVAEAKADTVAIESTHSGPRRALRVGRFTLALPGGTAKLAAYRLLEPGVDDHSLSLFFMDATCGKGSYHGGRYLDVQPGADGKYVVDLNNSYNPSCAYSPHYNCPIPPLENRIRLAVRAGESWPADEAPAR